MEYDDVVEAVYELFLKAETDLGEDVVEVIRKAYEKETNETARNNLSAILRNIDSARKLKVPMCQDTGIPIVFAEVGRELCIDFDLKQAIIDGVKKATSEIPMRPNAVHPLSRENPGNNVGFHVPQINIDLVDGDTLKLAVMPKGAGSENVSALRMLLPSQIKEIPKFIIDVVKNAMGKPCPPVFLGVGIGSTFDGCAKLAKKALLRDARKMTDVEQKITEMANRLGIGPMGLGGDTTVLGTFIEIGYCHTASLPVAVNVQCWANRRAVTYLR
ncbi:fumarase, class I alpha subunit [Archaeoglobus sulfaticallidus PM70-1]|uniref:Fumarase, class I alpha subunit n=1 Tax=Archaeoglobus sulfaticallidus PM70-1 TaxID=387631 RepID=N0BM28_9EURY|nr:fumarate hydratase [Archaeoglobus sulfaticallidus]AGK61646.1 fumarase, class I alpha subunit [Archaeoglobus sulfaticallidus PM70-1]